MDNRFLFHTTYYGVPRNTLYMSHVFQCITSTLKVVTHVVLENKEMHDTFQF